MFEVDILIKQLSKTVLKYLKKIPFLLINKTNRHKQLKQDLPTQQKFFKNKSFYFVFLKTLQQKVNFIFHLKCPLALIQLFRYNKICNTKLFKLLQNELLSTV